MASPACTVLVSGEDGEERQWVPGRPGGRDRISSHPQGAEAIGECAHTSPPSRIWAPSYPPMKTCQSHM